MLAAARKGCMCLARKHLLRHEGQMLDAVKRPSWTRAVEKKRRMPRFENLGKTFKKPPMRDVVTIEFSVELGREINIYFSIDHPTITASFSPNQNV